MSPLSVDFCSLDHTPYKGLMWLKANRQNVVKPRCLKAGMGTDFEKKKSATCAVTRLISLHPHPT